MCPNSHQTRKRTVDCVWCYDCSRVDDIDPVYDELIDLDTGDTVPPTTVSAT